MKPIRTQSANWQSLPKQSIKSGDAVYSRILDEHFSPFNEEEFRELLQCELEHKAIVENSPCFEWHINSPIPFLCEVYQFVLCEQSGPPKFSIINLIAGSLADDQPLPDGALQLEERVNEWLMSQPDEAWEVVPSNIAWNGEFKDGR